MKKIIWISSYPKSGNTWMRYLLSNYFYNINKKFDPNIIAHIKKFQIYNDIKKDSSKTMAIKNNPYEISKYWIKTQEILTEKINDVFFLKNHNACLKIENNKFTNDELTLGSIYIVRDPRDVVVSYAKYSNLSYDMTIEKLLTDKLICVIDKNDSWNIEIIGSWQFHYNSWKKGIPNVPSIIIKYEDLIDNCHQQFSKVIIFLSQIMNFKIDQEMIGFSVRESAFEKLQNNEKINDFSEKDGGGMFFRKGFYGDWINELSKEQIFKIEKALGEEMRVLGYKKFKND